MPRLIAVPLAGLALILPAAAHAELPPQLRTMLDAAIAGGKDAEIDTVAKYLKIASPEDAARIDGIVAAHRAQIAAARTERLAGQRFWQGWGGEGQVGASQSSGNTNAVGLSLGLTLRKEGLHWAHTLRAQSDYQRTGDETTRNQMLFALESGRKITDHLQLFGSAQYERDRFAGFSSRVSLAAGLGYRAVATPALTLDLKFAPAWRKSNYISEPHASELTAMGELNAAWKISPTLVLSENATALAGSGNTNINTLTALSFKVSSALSARVAYQLTTNTQPPPGFKPTDTLTRFTLVYGF